MRRFAGLAGLGLFLSAAGCKAGEGDTDAGADETTDGGEDWSPEGLSLGDVSFNSGVQTFVWKDGAFVEGPDRNSVILPGRKALVWVDYALEPEWVPRPVEERLVLVDTSGKETVLSRTRPLTLAQGRLEWIVDPGVLETGMEFAVEVVEVQDEFDPGSVVARIPEAGTVEVGVQGVAPEIKVVLVPFEATTGPCQWPFELEDHEQVVHAWMEAALPLGAVDVQLHEPIPLGEPEPIDENYPLTLLGDARTAADDDPAVLYFGYIRGCGGGRHTQWTVADNLGYLRGPELPDPHVRPEALFVFAVVQGLGQVTCTVEPQNPPDPNYPYEDGLIGVWGFNTVTEDVYDPDTTYSMLSDCEPGWFSDYEWKKLSKCLESGGC